MVGMISRERVRKNTDGRPRVKRDPALKREAYTASGGSERDLDALAEVGRDLPATGLADEGTEADLGVQDPDRHRDPEGDDADLVGEPPDFLRQRGVGDE